MIILRVLLFRTIVFLDLLCTLRALCILGMGNITSIPAISVASIRTFALLGLFVRFALFLVFVDYHSAMPNMIAFLVITSITTVNITSRLFFMIEAQTKLVRSFATS